MSAIGRFFNLKVMKLSPFPKIRLLLRGVRSGKFHFIYIYTPYKFTKTFKTMTRHCHDNYDVGVQTSNL